MGLEIKPGVWTGLFAKLEEQGHGKGREALVAIAVALEKQAKINASVGSHPYRTATPASPGTGPAVISGNLRRSLTHEPVLAIGPGHFRTRVGTATGFYPPYGSGTTRTPANKYGYYLEVTGVRSGAKFPFLLPAFYYATGVGAMAVYERVFGPGSWRSLT